MAEESPPIVPTDAARDSLREELEALRDSEARLRSILESAPNPIVTTDLDFSIRFINRTNVPGLHVDAATGQNMLGFVHDDDRHIAEAALMRVRSQGTVEQYQVRTNPAVVKAVYPARAAPVQRDGAIVGISIVLWDVTAQKKLEE